MSIIQLKFIRHKKKQENVLTLKEKAVNRNQHWDDSDDTISRSTLKKPL